MNIPSSFTVYTAALHALILILFYLLISGLGYPGLIVFQQLKHFHLPKQAAEKPYTSSKQQERHKHSVEITIKPSGSRGRLSLRTGSNPVPYIQCAGISHI